MEQVIKGYDYGSVNLEPSPITIEDLKLLQQSLLWSDEDSQYLRKAGEVLQNQIDEILDLWYGYVGSHQHLVYYFTDGANPIPDYLASVRSRFGQWIKDLCFRNYDKDWLNYQYEIAKRHHKTKKNKTDGVSGVPFVHFRYMVAFIYPITFTIKQFLAKSTASNEEIEKMYNAWFKAVVLTVTLWCYPYVKDGEF
ncbi:MAG: protoglobin domain-containing protein [Candidatus Kapaibacteriota bacterium]